MRKIAIKLDETIHEAVEGMRILKGVDDFVIHAGKELKIETTPEGEDYLATTVPEGKEWNVKIEVQIEEVDA